jgi:hypothetical protein
LTKVTGVAIFINQFCRLKLKAKLKNFGKKRRSHERIRILLQVLEPDRGGDRILSDLPGLRQGVSDS